MTSQLQRWLAFGVKTGAGGFSGYDHAVLWRDGSPWRCTAEEIETKIELACKTPNTVDVMKGRKAVSGVYLPLWPLSAGCMPKCRRNTRSRPGRMTNSLPANVHDIDRYRIARLFEYSICKPHGILTEGINLRQWRSLFAQAVFKTWNMRDGKSK
jgi:hypothetical protein